MSKWIEKVIANPIFDGRVYDYVIDNLEKELISRTLVKFNRNQLKVSEFLGINRNTLRSKMDKYNL